MNSIERNHKIKNENFSDFYLLKKTMSDLPPGWVKKISSRTGMSRILKIK